MAQRDRSHDPDDIDALLAEVDQTLHGRPASGRPPAARADQAAGSRGGAGSRLSRATRNGVIAGVVTAVLVGVAFALLPFLEVWSGSIGAFLGAFAAAFVFGLRTPPRS